MHKRMSPYGDQNHVGETINLINKSMISCKNSNINVREQFANVGKLSKRSNNAVVQINDYKLTRYACYLIAQNGDSRKRVISLAQTDAKLKRDKVDNE